MITTLRQAKAELLVEDAEQPARVIHSGDYVITDAPLKIERYDAMAQWILETRKISNLWILERLRVAAWLEGGDFEICRSHRTSNADKQPHQGYGKAAGAGRPAKRELQLQAA